MTEVGKPPDDEDEVATEVADRIFAGTFTYGATRHGSRGVVIGGLL